MDSSMLWLWLAVNFGKPMQVRTAVVEVGMGVTISVGSYVYKRCSYHLAPMEGRRGPEKERRPENGRGVGGRTGNGG